MKLFVSDYDGTYCKPTLKGQFEMKKNKMMTKRWQEKGNFFAFATGRSLLMMEVESRFRRLDYDYLIALNGAMIINNRGEILFTQSMQETVIERLMELMYSLNVVQIVMTDGKFEYHDYPFSMTDRTSYIITLYKWLFKKYQLTQEEILKRPIVQLSLKFTSEYEAIAFASYINEQFADEVVAYSNVSHVDITAKGISKATGVDFLVHRHEVDLNQVYCMGDSFNDLPMLEKYHGFSFKEAPTRVKEQARHIYETVGDAIASLLERHTTNK